MKIIFTKLLMFLWTNLAHSSVSGISYMDPIKMGSIKSKLPPGEDPCNPLYWYPRHIPEYCKFANTVRPASSEEPPAADPLPPAPPMLIPMPPPPIPILPPTLPIVHPPPIIAGPPPLFPAPPQASMIPISSNPYSYSHINPMTVFRSQPFPNLLPFYPSLQRSPAGFVPGIHSLVTKDGGINIMPFSDVYADMLEKYKNKMIRRKLHKILDKYEYDPFSRDYRTLRKYEKYFTDNK